MLEQGETLLGVAVEIRELLRLLAEPAIAQRDEKVRAAIKEIVGRSHAKQNATLLMDGNRSQKEIANEAKLDAGDLSKLVKALRAAELLTKNEKPQIRIPLPAYFFETGGMR